MMGLQVIFNQFYPPKIQAAEVQSSESPAATNGANFRLPQARSEHHNCHPEPPALANIAAGLRAEFDPRAILNRGLMQG